ncbi:MAG: carboxy terminal-processing peptidase [Gammaproteobacteria bacterium]|nr:carboxy terminal-processing peptidase [Gammaproteobacteria bacterium]
MSLYKTLSISAFALFIHVSSFAEVIDRDEQATLTEIIEKLQSQHYTRQPLNDEMSERWFNLYIDSLDPARMIFLQADIDEFEAYRLALDDYSTDADLTPLEHISSVFNERINARYDWLSQHVSQDLSHVDYSLDEVIERDRSDAQWPTDMASADDLWRRYVKNAALNLNIAGKSAEEIQETLLERYQAQHDRIKQLDSDDEFDQYANSLTRAYDPHSSYLSPRDLENFRISMSLQLEGIGAVLQQDGEYTKVVSLVNNGPADKQGDLSPSDRIVGVAQGRSGEFNDVIGLRLDEVVDQVRGEEGSWVRLKVLKRGIDDLSKAIEVAILREAVQLEESAATGEVHDVWDGERIRKVGVITIPKFYMDMQAYQARDPNFRSTSRDVYNILRDMREKEVEGIVIDLRNNGGGALLEADMLTDLFIDPGVVVQIRYGDERVSRQHRARQGMYYSGPLVVLTNRLSASASEIFAGAIKDYQRGIVVGETSFGKGTVQSVDEITSGAIKITESMFYRINGDSTQFQGVQPHIEFPLQVDPNDIGESTREFALNWEPIQAVRHNVWMDVDHYLPRLMTRHSERTAEDADFNYLRHRFAYMQDLSDDNLLTLNLEQRVAQSDANDARLLDIENIRRSTKGLDTLASLDEIYDRNTDSDELADDSNATSEDEATSDDANNDFVLDEATHILVDLIDVTIEDNIGRWVARDQ